MVFNAQAQVIQFTSTPVTTGTYNSAYSYNITTSGPVGETREVILASGTLPLGISLVDNGDGTALLSGSPGNSGTFNFTLRVQLVSDNSQQDDQVVALEVSKASATVTLSDLSKTYTGSPQGATVVTAPGGLSVDVTYDGSSTVPTDAGTYAVEATVNDPNYVESASGTLEIAKATGTVTLSSLTKTYNGSPQGATVVTSPGSLSVDVTYNGSSTIPTDAGMYAVEATINDLNYEGSASGTLEISKATATVTLSDLTKTYTGSPQGATVTTSPASLTVDVTYDASSTEPTDAGSYAVVATINDANYEGNTSGTLVISKASATIALSNLSKTYNGAPQGVTATTTPAGLSVAFTYNGATTEPTNAGSYTVIANIVDDNYFGNTSGTFVINKATATISLSDLTKTYTGAGQGATITTSPSGLTVNTTYNGSSTLPVNAGTYAVVSNINETNYEGSATNTLVINKATAGINISNLSQNYNGTAKSVTVTTTPSGLTTSVTYDGGSTLPVNQGSYAVEVTVNATNYEGTETATLVINGAPTSTAISNVNVAEDAANSTVNLNNSFDDLEDDDSELTYSIIGNSNPGLFSSVNISAGILTLDYAENKNGTSNITVRATDTGGLFKNESFQVNVSAVQDDPIFTSTPVTAAAQGQLYTYAITTSDPDAGDIISFQSVAIPDWLSFTDNGGGQGVLTGTPSNSDVGTDVVAIQITDNHGNTETQIFSISISNSNDTPEFTSIPIVEATEGVTYTYNVTTSDEDAGDTRTITATQKPIWLTLTDNGNGTATLTGVPSNDDTGDNDVTLRVTDNLGASTSQSFTIAVNNANSAPKFDSSPVLIVNEDATYTYNIQTSDSDAGDVLTITALAKPSWLTLTDNGNGTAVLTGTPTNDNVGQNSVVLNVADAEGAAVNQNFTITVRNTNDPPAFSSTPVTVAIQGSEYVYNITTTDQDVGDTRTITATTKPSWLTLTDNGNGSAVLKGTPDNADFGTHNVNIRVRDAAGSVVNQPFTITVDNANDPPAFTSTPVTSAIEDIQYTYNITVNDPDAGDEITITALSLPGWLTLTDNGNGTAVLTGKPLNSNVGNNTVVLNAKDAIGANVNQNFTISVANTNDAPVFTSAPITSAIQNISYTYNITTSDPDIGDSRVLTAIIKPDWLSFTDNGNGTAVLSGTPTNLNLGANVVQIEVRDQSGAKTYQNFEINVDNSNDPPAFTSTPVLTAVEDVVYTYNIITNDPDAGDILEIRGLTIPAWLTLTDNGNGTATLTGTPTNSNVGTGNVVLNIEDAQGLSVNQNFTITVSNTNDPPVFTSTPITGAIQGATYTYNINTSDPDLGDSRDITANTLPSWLTLTDNGNGTATLTGVPTNLNIGANPVQLVVTDQAGAAIQQNFVINVDNANDAPSFSSMAVTSAIEDDVYTYNITTSDPDNGDTRSITSLSKPSWLTLTDNGDGTAILTGTPLNTHVGSHTVVLNVRDALGANVNQSFTIVVSNVNDAPYFSSPAVTFAIQNQEYVYNITTADPDQGDSRTITVVSKPFWLSFTDNGNGTAVLSGTPGSGDLGAYQVTLNVEDAAGAAVDQIFTINVDNSNDAPQFSSTPTLSVDEDSQYTYEIATTDPDEGDTRSIVSLSKPSWLSLTDNGDGTAVLSGVPNNSQVGSYSIVLQVEDVQGATANQNFDIEVKNINDAPIFSSTPITGAIQDANYVYNILTSDVDAGDSRSITGTTLPSWLTLTDNGDGTATLTGTPSNSNFGANEVVLTVTDGAGAATNQNFVINVDNSNDQPSFSSTPVTTVDEDVVYIYNIKTTDPDAGDTRTITSLSALPAWLELIDNGDGNAQLTGTPNNDQVGSYSIVLKVQDALGSSDTQSFNIVVSNVNDVPLFTSEPIITARQSVAYTYNIVTADVDAGDSRTIDIVSPPSWLSLTDNGNGTATLSGTHPVDTEDNNIVYNIQLVVTDNQGDQSEQNFDLTVKFENQPPTLDIIPTPEAILEDTEQLVINLSGITAGDGENQNLSVEVTSDNEALVNDFTINYTSPATEGQIILSPEADAFGLANIIVTVRDDGAEVKNYVIRQFELTVTPVSDAPEFTSTPETTVIAGEVYTYNITVADPDPNDVLTIASVTLPSWLTFEITGENQAAITGTVPASGIDGDNEVELQVTDATNETATQSFLLNFNNAPILSPITTSIEEDVTLSLPRSLFENQFTDADDDELASVIIKSLPGHGRLTFNDANVNAGDEIYLTGTSEGLKYAPETNFNGNDSFQWNASDGLTNALSNGVASIAVLPINDKPTVEFGKPQLSFSQGDPLPLSDTTQVSIFDIDNNQMASAKIQITTNYVQGEDFLKLDLVQFPNLETSFDAASGTLSITGIDNNNVYEKAIAKVEYSNSILGEVEFNEKAIDVTVNDGELNSDVTTLSIIISEVFPDLVIFSAFTPNGDGNNDQWDFDNLQYYTDINISVYNQEAQVVYECNSQDCAWDGTYEGKELPAGPYLYTIDLNNGKRQYKGVVNILKGE
ncbi:MBG domain-containing protein [Fulvivirga ligni]|uniref:MBG domain-containing protein n=1 Tax=Fulvivirga ligni TaxID=2904246 RepID=UPI001F35C4E2|nr:MBG domain-containing protein [Fulvivirga ligni]UII19184.1 MBG domain-containing protein [Fulvivirga ligni]